MLNPGQEIFGIDRLIKNAGRGNLVAAQGRDERHGFPVPIGHLGGQPLAIRTPAAQRRHVCFGPSLVDKNQAAWINPTLIFVPEPPPAGDVRPILLGGQNAFFEAEALSVDKIPDRSVKLNHRAAEHRLR